MVRYVVEFCVDSDMVWRTTHESEDWKYMVLRHFHGVFISKTTWDKLGVRAPNIRMRNFKPYKAV